MNAIVMMVMTVTDPDAQLKAQVRQRIDSFIQNLPVAQFQGKDSHQKIETTANGDHILVLQRFFSETYSKAIRDMNTFERTLDVAMEFEQWMPRLTTYTTEPGRHHDCDFAVFRITHNGTEIEFKAKILPKGLKAHIIRIV